MSLSQKKKQKIVPKDIRYIDIEFWKGTHLYNIFLQFGHPFKILSLILVEKYCLSIL